MGWFIIFLLTTSFSLPFNSIAQDSTASVEGTVIDLASRRPIEFATISLISLGDSSQSFQTVSDKKGRFRIEGADTGYYILRSSFIGYTIQNSPAFHIKNMGENYQFGNIELVSATGTLEGITVTARRQSLVTGIDRKVYNVDQDIMSRSGSASDILKNIPSVEVDIEGEVLLRGSGDVMILINGKPSPLMGRSRADILQQLPANTIERIEVITNPSARYRPDGVSGIINIVLKKNTKNGFNATLNANAGNRDRYNTGINLNYRPKKINLFANYNYRRDTRLRYTDLSRQYTDTITGDYSGFFRQQSNQRNRPRGHLASAGFDYSLSEQSSFGISGNIFYRKQVKNDFTYNHFFNDQDQLTEQFERVRYGPEDEKERAFSVFFTHKFKGDEHELHIEFNNDRSEEIEDNEFTNIFYVPRSDKLYDNTLTTVIDRENQLTIDYSRPLGESAALEIGYDGQYDLSDLDFYGEYYDTIQRSFVKDLARSNQFIFNQDINAIYSTIKKSFEKWSFSTGLRAEWVKNQGRLITLDSLVKNRYFKIYPTIHLAYSPASGREFQLNYSKRVNRPDADELNPFPEYRDPRNLQSGNPALLPEIIHSVEFGFKWQYRKISFVPSIYYRQKVNGYTNVTKTLDDTILLTRRENLARDRSAGLELIFSARAGSWFSTNLSSNIFYNRIEAATAGFNASRSIFSMSTNFSANFNITKTTMAQVGTNYRSARLTAQGKTYPTTVFNLGIRQDMLQNKLSVNLTVSDLFSSLKQRNELETNRFRQTARNRRDGRVIYLGASFRFGILKKEKEEKMQFDDAL